MKKVVFRQKTVKVLRDEEGNVLCKTVMSDDKIAECEMPNDWSPEFRPMFGARVFIAEIGREVEINHTVGSTDGALICYLDVKETNDHEVNMKLFNKFNKLREEFADYKSKYKYEHRFFNFRKAK